MTPPLPLVAAPSGALAYRELVQGSCVLISAAAVKAAVAVVCVCDSLPAGQTNNDSGQMWHNGFSVFLKYLFLHT